MAASPSVYLIRGIRTDFGLRRHQGGNLKSHVFRVVLEPDEDVWRAYIPELENKGGATWGKTKEEALRNIHEVAQMVIESLLEDGARLLPFLTEVNDRVAVVTV
jgi:predicted RNase H-like HicB family nuclease